MTGMTKEEEFDSFIIGSFLDLYHIMESRMEAEEERRSGVPTIDKKVDVGTELKAEHPEWYSATGSLGVRVSQIDTFGVKDAEMEHHFVPKLDSKTINKLDNTNRRDMRNWSDED